MKVVSPEFQQLQPIPARFTCLGEDHSVPLQFLETPKGTKTFAIIVDDPDAPSGIFTHWVAWNIPAETTSLSEGQAAPQEGKNSFGSVGYRGPCPPPGKPHRYFFKVFALDTVLDLPKGSTKEQLEKAMKGHTLSQAELVGTFQRTKP